MLNKHEPVAAHRLRGYRIRCRVLQSGGSLCFHRAKTLQMGFGSPLTKANYFKGRLVRFRLFCSRREYTHPSPPRPTLPTIRIAQFSEARRACAGFLSLRRRHGINPQACRVAGVIHLRQGYGDESPLGYKLEGIASDCLQDHLGQSPSGRPAKKFWRRTSGKFLITLKALSESPAYSPLVLR